MCATAAERGVAVRSEFAGSGAAGLRETILRLEQGWVSRGDGRSARYWRVLSVDPGKITGVAVYWLRRSRGKWVVKAWAETLLAGDEHGQVRDLTYFWGELMRFGPVDVVLEDFVVRRIAMEYSFLSPVRIGRAFEWGLWLFRKKQFFPYCVQWVSSSEMAAMRDERLKALGHYTPGPDHRRDASRHALLHIRSVNAGNRNRNSVVWGLTIKKSPGPSPVAVPAVVRTRLRASGGG